MITYYTLTNKLSFFNFNLKELEVRAIDIKYQNNKLIMYSFSTNEFLLANKTFFFYDNFF